jgi:hypothetical protein
MYEDRLYAIVDAIEFQRAMNDGDINIGIMFSKIMETDLNTLRYSVDRSKFIVKCEKESDMEYLRERATECNIPYSEYTHEEILKEVSKPEWNEE